MLCDDIIFIISLCSSITTIFRLRRVSQNFYDIISDECFWKNKYGLDYNVPSNLSKSEKMKHIITTNKIMILADKYYNWINFKNNICRYLTTEDKHRYIYENQILLFKKLLKSQFYPNLKFKENSFLIHKMIEVGKFNIVKLLLNNQLINVNIGDFSNNSCIHYLFKQYGKTKENIISFLELFKNFDFTCTNNKGETILHSIFRNLDLNYGYHTCAQRHSKNNCLNNNNHQQLNIYLSTKGVDVNKKDKNNFLYFQY